MRRLLARDREHRAALVEGGDVSAQVPREEARAAGDVERACRRERRDDTLELGPLLVPSRPVAVGERAAAEPPIVVLAGARVVVGLHAPRVFGCSNPSRTSRRDAKRRRSRRSRPRSRRRRGCWTSTQTATTTAPSSPWSETKTSSRIRWSPASPARASESTCAATKARIRRIGAADVVPLVPLRPDGDGPGESRGCRGRGADRGGTRAAGFPLRRVCCRPGPRVLPPRRPGGAAEAHRHGRARAGLRAGPAGSGSGRSSRRRAASLDRLQRQSPRVARGGARDRGRRCARREAAFPASARSASTSRAPASSRSA